MSREPGRDWRAILLLVGGGGTGLLAVGVALLIAAYGALDASRGQQTTSPAAQMAIGIVLGALVLVGGILIIAAYQALKAIHGKPEPPLAHPQMRRSTILVLILVWLASSILAQAVVHAGGPTWLASPLHLLAIGSPVYLLTRLATAGLPGGSPLRMWGGLATGLVCGPGISAVAEIALLLAGMSAAAVVLVLNPGYLLALEGLVSQLRTAPAVDNALVVLQPILMHPMALGAVLVTVSVVTPIVEEVAKSAAPWFMYHRLHTAAQGFFCGAVSGAGFALVEGLMASADMTGNWIVIFLIRGWSSTMHILASALAGWGIAAFRVTGRASRLVAGYALAIGIHAVWNAAVVGIGYGGLRSAFSQSGPDAIAMAAIIAGGSTLLVLVVALPAAMLWVNHRLRTPVGSLEVRRLAGNRLTSSSPPLKG